MLQARRLGSTGLVVSPLGLGTVKLGRNKGVKYPGEFEIPTDAQAADLLRAAQKAGITLLDTAPAYGQSEERLGRIVPACGGRDRWTIVTKAGEEFDAASAASRYDFSAAAIRASAERSLKRLKTDRVECLLLHSDGRDEWILRESGALEALAALKKKGLIRAGGISTKTPEGGALAVAMGPEQGIDVVMLTLNAEYADDLPAIRAAASRAGGATVGVFIKKALMSGHAAPGAAAGSGPGAALGVALGEPAVSSVIVGTISREHLIENARAAEALIGSAPY